MDIRFKLDIQIIVNDVVKMVELVLFYEIIWVVLEELLVDGLHELGLRIMGCLLWAASDLLGLSQRVHAVVELINEVWSVDFLQEGFREGNEICS